MRSIFLLLAIAAVAILVSILVVSTTHVAAQEEHEMQADNNDGDNDAAATTNDMQSMSVQELQNEIIQLTSMMKHEDDLISLLGFTRAVAQRSQLVPRDAHSVPPIVTALQTRAPHNVDNKTIKIENWLALSEFPDDLLAAVEPWPETDAQNIEELRFIVHRERKLIPAVLSVQPATPETAEIWSMLVERYAFALSANNNNDDQQQQQQVFATPAGVDALVKASSYVANVATNPWPAFQWAKAVGTVSKRSDNKIISLFAKKEVHDAFIAVAPFADDDGYGTGNTDGACREWLRALCNIVNTKKTEKDAETVRNVFATDEMKNALDAMKNYIGNDKSVGVYLEEAQKLIFGASQ